MAIPAHAKVDGKMIGDADCILREGSIVVGIGMRGGLAKILKIVLGDLVGIGAEGRERKSGFHRCEGEGIHLDRIEEILTALPAGEEIVDPG